MLLIKKNILNEKTILTIILLIALVLRVYKLDSKSIWLDEGLALWLASRDSIPSMFKELSYNLHPPIYYLFFHYWLKYFGTSEIALRSISVISGTAAVFMTYKIGKIIYNKSVGLISAFLSAISVFLINYSQDAKSCSFICFLTTLSIYFFIKYLKTNKLKALLWYVLSSSLLVLAHTTGLFTLSAQFVYILISKAAGFKDTKSDIKKILFAQALITGVVIIWLMTVRDQIPIRSASIIAWIEEPSIRSFIDTFRYLYSGSIFIFIIFLLFILIALFDEEKNKTTLILTLCILPPGLLFVISKLWHPVYLDRYTIGASIPFYILVAKGILMTKPATRSFGILFILLASFEPLNNYYLDSSPYNYRKINWKQVVTFIEKNASNNDLIIFDAWYVQRLLFNYYSRRKDLIKFEFSYDITLPDYKKIAKEISPKLKNYKRIWLINYHMDDKKMLIEKSIRRNYKLANKWTYNKNDRHDELEIKLYKVH